jgi:hypothetical protein
MITFWDYAWDTKLAYQMSFDEIDQALIVARGLKTDSDLAYWQKIDYIEDLQKHLKPAAF